MLMPALGKAWENSERSIMYRDAALTALALTLYHRQHQVWPQSLEELTPALIPTLPVDRFSGRTLGYRVVDGQPILYSVGADRDDDGGLEPVAGNVASLRGAIQHWNSSRGGDDGDWIFWPVHPEPRFKINEGP